MLDMLLNSKAAAGALASAFAPEPGNAISGGSPLDARAFLGAGAGWTVATGSARAEGARMTDPAVAAYGTSVTAAPATMQAGGGVLMWVLGAVALGMLVRKLKKD